MTYTQLINSLITYAPHAFSLAALGIALYLVRAIRLDNPTKAKYRLMKLDVCRLDGEMSDLEERFTRFQKRKGMQEAREVKTSREELVAEAAQLVQQGATAVPPLEDPIASRQSKLDLYQKAKLVR